MPTDSQSTPDSAATAASDARETTVIGDTLNTPLVPPKPSAPATDTAPKQPQTAVEEAAPAAPLSTEASPPTTASVPPEAPAAAGSKAPVTEPSAAHVLVVEDNVPNFVLIARMLAFMGVQRCEWKTSGWQVVQFADTLPRVDLILMDIRLPYEDGYQALQKLRANARLKDTIVCAVTAEASEDQMRRAKKAGFNGFLGKPLDPDRFPNQIRRLLSGEEVWEWK